MQAIYLIVGPKHQGVKQRVGRFSEIVYPPLLCPRRARRPAALCAFFRGPHDRQKAKVLRDSIITAFLITLAFIVIGNGILHYLNISIHDFLIAGGIILFIISTRDLMGGRRKTWRARRPFAVVPLGVPLLAGPALLTTSLIVYNTFGFIFHRLVRSDRGRRPRSGKAATPR